MIKDTLLWTVGSAFILLFNSTKVNKTSHYFTDIVLENFKLLAVFEFIVNFYVFSLLIEIILILTILVILSAFSATKEDHKKVKKVLDAVLAYIGILFSCFAIYSLAKDWQGFATVKNLRDFVLGFNLTLMYIPFLYLVALYMIHDL